MSVKRLISREIRAVKQTLRGRVISEPKQVSIDPGGSLYYSWVVDVDCGGDQILRDVLVKLSGGKGRFYAKPGSPVFLEKDAQGRYQIVGPGDRSPSQSNLLLLDESAGTVSDAGSLGFSYIKRPFIYYKGTTPESFYDPAADVNVILWLRGYDRLTGRPVNITTATDADGAAVSRLTDKSGNGRHAIQATAANQPVYRKFDAVSNANDRSTVDFDGSNDGMPLAANVLEAVPGAISIFVACCKDAAGAGDDVVLQLGRWRIYSRVTAADAWGFDQGGGIVSSGQQVTTEIKVLELVAANFNSLDLYADGVALGHFTPGGAGLATGSSVLGNSDALTLSHNGRVAEVLIVDGAVTDQKRLTIEAYFRQSLSVAFSKWHTAGFPKTSILDADGNEV